MTHQHPVPTPSIELPLRDGRWVTLRFLPSARRRGELWCVGMCGETAVAVAQYVRREDGPRADLSVVVQEAFRGVGIGRWIVATMAVLARDAGIVAFVGQAPPEARPVLRILRSSGARMEWDGEVWRAQLPVQRVIPEVDGRRAQALRAAARAINNG